MNLRGQLAEIISDGRTGVVAAAGTMTVSFAQLLNLIPENIGKLSVLLACLLTSTLIVIHVRAEIRKTKIDNLRIRSLQRGIDDDD